MSPAIRHISSLCGDMVIGGRNNEEYVLFWCQKRTRKSPAIERLGGGEAMKAPVGLSSRQSGLRSKCRVFSAARTGTHEKGAARPFQTPKELSKRKKASRFAKTGCGSQRLLRCRSHPAGRCPNSSSLFPPLAAVVAVALFSRFSDLESLCDGDAVRAK